MDLFMPVAPLIFLFLLCPGAPTFCNSLPIAPLAFKCSPPRQPAIDLHLARSLLGSLTSKASHAGFAASSVAAAAGGDRLHGLTQCRSDLQPAACAACLSAAADAVVSSLCMGAPAAAGWFVDGCYLHYYYGSREDFLREARPFEARSNGSYAPDRADFPPAAGALLRRLVAEAGLPSRRGFSYGEASYGNGGGCVYAAAECLRSVPPERCRECLTGAAAMARACCGRMEGGLAVAGDCTIRFESRRFLWYMRPEADTGTGHSAASTASTAAITTYDDDDEGGGSTGLKVKVVLVAWLAGVACLVGFAMGLWQMRRRILSVKVAAATFPEDTEGGERDRK